jgi:hypothetical protein
MRLCEKVRHSLRVNCDIAIEKCNQMKTKKRKVFISEDKYLVGYYAI